MKQKPTRDGETAEHIASVLRAEIIAGDREPGEVLYQEELADRFQTSRMPIRDSLKILEREGLVVVPANKSATVSPLDPASFVEINEMRAVAEPLALKIAMPELTNRQIDRAITIQDEAERSDIAVFAALNRDFHMALIQPCERPRLLAHIASLNDASQRYFHLTAVDLDYSTQSHDEHRALIAACMARNTEKACAILERHILSASEKMRIAMLSKA
ncbi:GntR family transcriptional regulator [uncultured Sulfitobacter sp.]|jgi:DNA-binding GntR family transcriptional regulator|uniref:GntR family transcriptional regulator n=1 Tax=uncultured Sulfitobacter sp. TaxID=191468 RepID=UPI0030FC6F8D